MPSEHPQCVMQQAKTLNWLSLLTSSSTLICCALPATLVGLGAVATLSSLMTSFPQLIWLSEQKPWVFGLAGLMLLLSGALQWRAERLPCPTDPQLAKLCQQTRKRGLVVYWVSVGLYGIGAFFAFVAPLLI